MKLNIVKISRRRRTLKFRAEKIYVYYEHIHGVGKKKAAMHAASQAPNAALHAASAGVAAITAPGTVPKVKPAAVKHATATPAQPA